MAQRQRRILIPRWRLAWLGLFFLAPPFPPSGLAAPAADSTTAFNIPAGEAATALKQFARQSGVELLYSSSMVAGVKTNPVHGDFRPREALALMLQGTELIAAEGKNKQALAVIRAPPAATDNSKNKKKTDMTSTNLRIGWMAALLLQAGTARLTAQTGAAGTAASGSSAGQPSEQVVKMSAFEVQTTQGHGYSETNAASALKTNENIMDIPQSILVVTNDLINDIGAHGTTDTLQFVGVANTQANLEFTALRGTGTGYPYVDDMPDNESFSDDAFVDTYEIIKGPTESLYLNAAENGVVLISTKKPLPFPQVVLTAKINDWGQYRFVADATGPIGNVGDAKLGYRVVLWDQGGGFWAQNQVDDRKGIFFNGETDYHDATVRVDWYHQNIIAETNPVDIITPTGQIYLPSGRTFDGAVPNTMIEHVSNRFSFHWLQKISNNWEAKTQAAFWNLLYYGGIWNPSTVNWSTPVPTVNPLVRLNNYFYQYWTFMQDYHGKYSLGPLVNQDAFGFAYSEYTAKSMGVPWPAASSFNGTPFTAAAFNAVQAPQWYQYKVPAALGTYAKTEWTQIYWQHSIDVIPNWLTLVGGWTWDSDVTNSVANISTLPYVDIYNPQQAFVHRLAAVFKPLRDISIYVLDETSYSPASGSALQINGQLLPGSFLTDTEMGLKTAFFNGRLSTDFSWFRMPVSNTSVLSTTLSPITGQSYYTESGLGHVEEGVDGDATFTLVPGFQLVGAFYAGHDRQSNGVPVSISYDNMWSFFARYDFPHDGPLRGLTLGGGVSRIGGRWLSPSGITAYPPGEAAPALGAIKLQAGTMASVFVNYSFNKHLSLRVGADNVLNQTYVAGFQSAVSVDPSIPRTWSGVVTYKF